MLEWKELLLLVCLKLHNDKYRDFVRSIIKCYHARFCLCFYLIILIWCVAVMFLCSKIRFHIMLLMHSISNNYIWVRDCCECFVFKYTHTLTEQ